MSLEAEFVASCQNPDVDTHRHLPSLYALARQCQHVTEFGTGGGHSTVTLLFARPKTYRGYDVAPPHERVERLYKMAVGWPLSLCFVQADTATVRIDPTDLLFVDTLHTYSHVAAELKYNADKVRKFIVFHDTAIYGTTGADKQSPGVLGAIQPLLDSGVWKIHSKVDYCYGLTVLERTKPMNEFTLTTPAFRHRMGLDALLDSIQQSTTHPRGVLVIDNGCDLPPVLPDRPFPVRVISPGYNMGVAGAWNLGRREAQTPDLIVCNDDVVFGPNTLEQMVSAPSTAGMVFIEGPDGVGLGYTCFNLRRWFFDLLGPFDEGFFPAYYEDCDYTERFVKSGLPSESFHLVKCEIAHKTAQRGQLQWVRDGWARNQSRFIAKWGHDPASGGHGLEKGYRRPWNSQVG